MPSPVSASTTRQRRRISDEFPVLVETPDAAHSSLWQFPAADPSVLSNLAFPEFAGRARVRQESQLKIQRLIPSRTISIKMGSGIKPLYPLTTNSSFTPLSTTPSNSERLLL